MPKKIYSILFTLAIFLGGAANIAANRQEFERGMAKLAPPRSVPEARDVLRHVNRMLNGAVAGRHELSEIYGFIHVILGKNEMGNFHILRSPSGKMDYGNIIDDQPEWFLPLVERIDLLKSAVDRKGGKFIFLSPPDRALPNIVDYPRGVPFENLNSFQDAFLDTLREHDVPFLDMRYEFLRKQFPPERILLKTDHRWTIPAAFEAFRSLIGHIETRFDISLDPDGFYRNEENYRIRTYPKSFAGSFSRLTGIVFGGVEDFTLVLPAYQNDFLVHAADRFGSQRVAVGGLEQTLYSLRVLESTDPYISNPLDVYLSGLLVNGRIANLGPRSQKRLLFLGGSHSLPLVCFLAPLFGETRFHMLNETEGLGGATLEEIVDEDAYDVVVFMCGPSEYRVIHENIL